MVVPPAESTSPRRSPIGAMLDGHEKSRCCGRITTFQAVPLRDDPLKGELR